MVRERDPAGLPIWITDPANSILTSLGKGILPSDAPTDRTTFHTTRSARKPTGKVSYGAH